MKNRCQPGFIMILTLVLISLLVGIATYIANRGLVYAPFSRTVVSREQAKQLALGGIQLGMSLLAVQADKEPAKPAQPKTTDAEKKPEKSEENQNEKKLLETILPSLNIWQIFDLKQDVDGIDGKLEVCISCEDGKININKMAELYDFKKKKFKDDINEKDKSLSQGFESILKVIAKKIGKKIDPLPVITQLAKGRQEYKLNDVTELLLDKAFVNKFKNDVFYDPPESGKKKKKRPVYLTDLFTVWSGQGTIQPWLFSDSMLDLLGLKRAVAEQEKKRKSAMKKWLEQFSITSNWQEDWNKILAPVYGKDFKSLPKDIESILSNKFEPSVFSVLTQATVGNVSQRFFAIVERTKKPTETKSEDKEKKEGEKENGGRLFEVKIKKLYWL